MKYLLLRGASWEKEIGLIPDLVISDYNPPVRTDFDVRELQRKRFLPRALFSKGIIKTDNKEQGENIGNMKEKIRDFNKEMYGDDSKT